MAILLSGDYHANSRGEIDLIYKDRLIDKYGQEKYDRIKYHIILGDAGFMWPHNKENDARNYKILAERHFPILCVIGNHEPFYGKTGLPEADIGIGETVYRINENPFTAYLKRGKVYTIDGIKLLALGGALSIDKYRRVSGKTWWEQEYWSEQEKKDLFKLLETDHAFDFVISHTGPHHINLKLFEENFHIDPDKFYDNVAFLNDEIHSKIQFGQWFCGHFHEDEYYYDAHKKRGYQYLYRSTRLIEKIDGVISVCNGIGEENFINITENNIEKGKNDEI